MEASAPPAKPRRALHLDDPGPRPASPGPKAVAADLRYEWGARRRGFRPVRGHTGFSVRRTWGFRHDPLRMMLESYERFGPIFGIRVLHGYSVTMLGPEANHYILVSDREKFLWRNGHMGDLITLLGDGLLTTDGGYHDTSRAIMMPAFHKERVAASVEVMAEEAETAVEQLRPNQTLDVYHWTRDLAMRIAMRALFGFDPDSGQSDEIAARFESGLGFHGREFPMQVLVGPGSPYRKLLRDRAALERLVGGEIRRRRDKGDDGSDGEDMLGALLGATDEDGRRLSDMQILDHVLTLLFAGHDTTTSTVSFLIYELARNPAWLEKLAVEQQEVVGGARPTAEQLFADMPLLGQAIDETLRLYPPAWIGARRASADFEFRGARVAAGTSVSYSSWASHRLPDVWADPHAFRPERFAPEARAKFPRGAYVPFGAGPRICIGKRFGYTEVHAIAAALLSRFSFELPADHELEIQWAPTLSPKGGLQVSLQ